MNKEEFANRLDELMAENNRTARDISLNIGQNSGYVNSILNKRAYPSMDVFFKICDELKITPVDFFDTDTRYPEMLNRIIPYLMELKQDQLENITLIVKAICENNK
ncbi:MAG: helix-turn-helix domain-containing protein [Eubacterium sp.]|nr:helix-turn-helix domain-containing protein [Eubacterium sp.]